MSAELGPLTQPLTVGTVVEYLRAEQLIDEARLPPPAWAQRPITGVATDRTAQAGEVAMLTPKTMARAPERLQAFAGSLLIVPTASVPADAPAYVVGAEDPKMAVVAVVGRFFPHLVDTEWPYQGHVPRNVTVAANVQLSPGVAVGSNTTIGEGVIIGPNTCIANTIVAPGVIIGANCSIGLPGFGYRPRPDGTFVRFPHMGGVIIEANVEIGSNTCIDRGALGDTVIKRGAKIDNLVHIAHNVIVGEDTLVIAHAMIGGSTEIGARAWIAPSAAVMNQISVGDGAIIGLGAVVVKSVAASTTVVGNPAKPLTK